MLVTIQQLTAPSTPPQPGGQPPEPTVQSKTGPTQTYTAGWLPDGFAETYRAVGQHGMQLRQWTTGRINVDRWSGDRPPTISLALHTTAEPQWADAAEAIKEATTKVQIQNHPGAFPSSTRVSARG